MANSVEGLFRHDDSTGSASVQFWAVAATVLLLLKFAVGSLGPRFSSRRLMSPFVRMLEILNYYAVNYTLGLMKISNSPDRSRAVAVNSFFQVWAVLITTMQDSIRIGRPYKPKEMSLIDLLSSLWSANQLRAPAPRFLKVPLWLMWSIHAVRIVWYYLTFNRAGQAGLKNMKLVSDYMMTSQHTDKDACPRTMSGYRYIVFGEDEQKMEVLPPLFTMEMDLRGTEAHQLITLDDIWKQAGEKKDRLLSSTADPDNRFKDACLSFALYKLQRRRFYNFPIAEVTHQATKKLISDNILKVANELVAAESRDQQQQVWLFHHVKRITTKLTICWHAIVRCLKKKKKKADDELTLAEDLKKRKERVFRITEVELSFLQDMFYSKHAAVFAWGFPYVRLALSQLMTAAALYLVYAVHDLPSARASAVVTPDGRVARITNAVFVTHCIIAVVVCRELWEVAIYVVSQWTKVWIIGRHMKLTRRLTASLEQPTSTSTTTEHGGVMSWRVTWSVKWCQKMWWPLQLVVLDKVARVMFFVVQRGQWDQQIRQYNILVAAFSETNRKWILKVPQVVKARIRLIVKRKTLQIQVAGELFQTLKDLIDQIPPASSGGALEDARTREMTNNNLLKSFYFKNAFGTAAGSSSLSSSATHRIFEDPMSKLDGETHKILVWHIATSLCQIKLLNQAGQQRGHDLYSLSLPQTSPSLNEGSLLSAAEHYATAVSLSNYCAYLVTEALLPDNGLVAEKVFDYVSVEVRQKLHGCTKISEIHDKLQESPPEEKTILAMGAQLSEALESDYSNRQDELWKRLAKFWAGFLLHLSASTRAAKHLIHLQGRGELTTHLWVLLSRAGFLGDISHGELLPDPVDQSYA